MPELHPDYPLPDVDDPVMRPFWEGARRRKLLLQRDRRSGRMHWPPKPLYWSGGELEWFEASGKGTIYSYVVAHEPFLPALRHLLPHVMVLVETDEGPRLVGYMIHCRPDEMSFGMRVRVAFEPLTERVTLPVWEPDR
jgi:uncharacterized OB-fold protein